jgi:hypothetical protein
MHLQYISSEQPGAGVQQDSLPVENFGRAVRYGLLLAVPLWAFVIWLVKS